MVPLIKTGTTLQLTHSMEFYLPKAELVTTISCCPWNQPAFSLFPIPFLFGVNSSLKKLPLGLLISRYPQLWERSTCGGSFEMQPQNAAMWKSQCSGMLWPFVLPSAFFFFFFLKSCREGYSYMNLNFNRRGKKVDMALYLSICKKAVLQAAGTNYDLFFCLDKHNGPLR